MLDSSAQHIATAVSHSKVSAVPNPVRPAAGKAAGKTVGKAAAKAADGLHPIPARGSAQPISKAGFVGGGAAVMTVPHRFQGEDASCGPSSLWMILGYHKGRNAVDFETLDRTLRPTNRFDNLIGTTPTALADAAREHGMAATVTNNADTGHLRKLLDAGRPSILLGTWTDGKEAALHFVVINGYEGTDDATAKWHITDPYVEGNNGKVVYSTQQLMDFWHYNPDTEVPYPYQRAVINIAPASKAADLPADNRPAVLKVLDAATIAGTNVLRYIDNPKS